MIVVKNDLCLKSKSKINGCMSRALQLSSHSCSYQYRTVATSQVSQVLTSLDPRLHFIKEVGLISTACMCACAKSHPGIPEALEVKQTTNRSGLKEVDRK